MTVSELSASKGIRQLCGALLAMEAIVIALAIVPAAALEHINGAVAGAVGGGLAILAIALASLIGRPGKTWALIAGSALQFVVIAAGVAVPVLYILGGVFTALWLTSLYLVRKVARLNATRARAAAPPANPPPTPNTAS